MRTGERRQASLIRAKGEASESEAATKKFSFLFLDSVVFFSSSIAGEMVEAGTELDALSFPDR